ncbi:MAG: hypothetical protein C5B51_28125 [Terriglobia bacterium]|nr:MAG: hypothetical protein C5B51_28125 [Terriglobia bacterium]
MNTDDDLITLTTRLVDSASAVALDARNHLTKATAHLAAIDGTWALSRELTQILRARTSFSAAYSLDALGSAIVGEGVLVPNELVQKITELRFSGRTTDPPLLVDQLGIKMIAQLAPAGGSLRVAMVTAASITFDLLPDINQVKVSVRRQRQVTLLDPVSMQILEAETLAYGAAVANWFDGAFRGVGTRLTDGLGRLAAVLAEPPYPAPPPPGPGPFKPWKTFPGKVIFVCTRIDDVLDFRALIFRPVLIPPPPPPDIHTLPDVVAKPIKEWDDLLAGTHPPVQSGQGHESPVAWPSWAEVQVALRTDVLGRRVDRHARELVAQIDPRTEYQGTNLMTNPADHRVASYFLWARKRIFFTICGRFRLVIQGPFPWNWYFECTEWVQSSITIDGVAEATVDIADLSRQLHLVLRVISGTFKDRVMDVAALPNATRAASQLTAEAMFLWLSERPLKEVDSDRGPSAFYLPWREHAAK